MTDWKIYYDDGSTFSSEDGSWEEAPCWGVAAVATPDRYVGREIDTGDFYVLWPGAEKPWAVDSFGALDYLLVTKQIERTTPLTDLSAEDLEQTGMKMGRSMDNTPWRELWEKIAQDADVEWKVKDGTRKAERVPPPNLE